MIVSRFRLSPGPALILCLLVLAACNADVADDAKKGGGKARAVTVNGIVATARPLDNVVRSSGTVLASESVELTAEAAGRVDSILFAEGAHVRKNALLVKINDDELQAQLRKAELQIQLATEQEARQRQLLEKQAVSSEQYDITLNQLNQLRADRENLLAAIRKKVIRAPFDGVVGLRYISPGSYVTAATRIASLQKIHPVKIDFAIPEKYAADVAPGDVVHFRNDAGTLRFTGTLYAIEPNIDAATRTLQLRARCDNAAGKILPGAYVDIELRLKQIPNALMVPTQAIVPVLKGQTLLLGKNGRVVSVPVTTGTRTPTGIQITSGIAAGDTVITTGMMQLRAGMPVRVQVK